jgi:hypothetical protein
MALAILVGLVVVLLFVLLIVVGVVALFASLQPRSGDRERDSSRMVSLVAIGLIALLVLICAGAGIVILFQAVLMGSWM